MKVKKIIRIIFVIILIALSIFISISSLTYASSTIDGLGDLDKYKGNENDSSVTFDKIANNVVYLLGLIGSILSVVTLVIMGIKYMIGSIEEKAEYKKSMLPYLIGSILVFGISNLTGLIYFIAKNIF